MFKYISTYKILFIGSSMLSGLLISDNLLAMQSIEPQLTEHSREEVPLSLTNANSQNFTDFMVSLRNPEYPLSYQDLIKRLEGKKGQDLAQEINNLDDNHFVEFLLFLGRETNPDQLQCHIQLKTFLTKKDTDEKELEKELNEALEKAFKLQRRFVEAIIKSGINLKITKNINKKLYDLIAAETSEQTPTNNLKTDIFYNTVQSGLRYIHALKQKLSQENL